MQYRFSKRIEATKPSAIRAVAAKAEALVKQGVEVISFTAGEPDFTSPAAAREYAIRAMDKGDTHYTGTTGNDLVREAVCLYYKREFGLQYGMDEVIVGAGAKPLIYEALGCLIDPGDEVLIFAPAWVSYLEQVGLFDGKPVVIDTAKTGLRPTIADVRKAVTDKTRAVILNSPNNPTGKLYTEEFLRELCKLCLEKGIIIINDEIYEKIMFDGHKYLNPVQILPESRSVVLNINGASKAFAMTGWRMGYAVGPKEIIKKMSTMQGHITSAASTISQWATAGAIKEAMDDVKRMSAEYQKRKDRVMALLKECPHIKCDPPDGSFYAFVDIRPLVGKKFDGKAITDDVQFCEMILDAERLAFVPGTAFLAPGFFRMSFATELPMIEKGLGKLKKFLSSVQ